METGAGRPAHSDEPLRGVTSGVGDRLAKLRDRLSLLGVRSEDVTVVAVTKGFGVEAVLAAQTVGIADIGENYAQELLSKAAALRSSGECPFGRGVADGVRWHFLGAIQRNKVKKLAPALWRWDSVARIAEAEAISRVDPGASVLIEVNVTEDPRRNGCGLEEAPRLAEGVQQFGLDLQGLMTVAPPISKGTQESFRRVRRLTDHLGLAVCSMGMSSDFELAVAEGSTELRIGQALFGERPRKQSVL